jgi:hypothetical protein
MDVGLNNRNYLHKKLGNSYLEDVEWIVEATSEERFNLWQDYHNDPKYNWEEVSRGWSYYIIELNINGNGKIKSETLPVYINFSFAIINGHKICFYTSNSLLVHHGYIESFLTTYFQRTHDDYSRWNHTDSANFHNCIGYLEDIDLEPRDTIYEKEDKYYIWDLPE